MNIKKSKLGINVPFNSQFKDCLLTWLFQKSTLNNTVNGLKENYLVVVYNYNQSFYEKLDKDHAGLMRYQNLLFIMIELHEVLSGLSPVVMR